MVMRPDLGRSAAWRDVVLGIVDVALDRVPSGSSLEAALRRRVDRGEGQNNGDPATNGEHWLISTVLTTSAPVVFDVGANDGAWTTFVLEHRPYARVHCFEPSAATFALLEARALGDTVELNRAALGSEDGELQLHVFGDGSGMNSFNRREGLEVGWGFETQGRSERVSVTTLDAYCRARGVESIDLLKLDVEGFELEVLRGASEMLASGRVRCVQFEYGGCNIDARVLLKDIFALVENHGYTLAKLLPHGLRWYPRYDQRAENFQYSNWIAVLPGDLVER